MPATIETRIFRLHHDAAVSARIGYLASQQRLAYNHAVDVLNRTPDIALLKSPRNPDGLLGQITLWRRQDERADAPYIIHQSGTQQAWLANSLMKQERNARLIRLENGSTKSADHRQHRRTLAHRSRKRGSSTLSSLTPPVRLDDSTFTVMGARDVVLRTKKPVPDDLDIRSFQIVEVRRTHRGVNGALGERRYALHLQIAVEYPEPPEAEAIETPDANTRDGRRRQEAYRVQQRGVHPPPRLCRNSQRAPGQGEGLTEEEGIPPAAEHTDSGTQERTKRESPIAEGCCIRQSSPNIARRARRR